MKISIITATYNSVQTIESCMMSVVQQTYPNIEYIIIDGKSNDGTLDIVNQFQTQYSNVDFKIVSEPDNGIYDALNKGINKATGDVVGFVHSDDFLADTTIISQIAEAFKADDVDGVYGDLHYVQFDDTNKISRNWISQPFQRNLLNRGWMPAHPTLFLKREVYDIHGGFDLTYSIAADYDFILRIFKQKNYAFKYLPHTIMKMRVGGVSNRGLRNLIQKTKEDYRAVKTNQLNFPFWVLIQKNLSKIPQWLS